MKIRTSLSVRVSVGHSDILVLKGINKPTVSSSATSRRPIDRRGAIHAQNEKRASGRIDLAGFDSGAQYRNSHSIAPNSFLRPRQSPLRHNKFMVPFRARTHTQAHACTRARAQTRTHYNKTAACLIE